MYYSKKISYEEHMEAIRRQKLCALDEGEAIERDSYDIVYYYYKGIMRTFSEFLSGKIKKKEAQVLMLSFLRPIMALYRHDNEEDVFGAEAGFCDRELSEIYRNASAALHALLPDEYIPSYVEYTKENIKEKAHETDGTEHGIIIKVSSPERLAYLAYNATSTLLDDKYIRKGLRKANLEYDFFAEEW